VAQGANIKGYDCSGLTLYAYAQVGIGLPHYTGSQFNAGIHVTKAQLRPGDLVFFYSDLHHMGMYIGNGKMVHAPQTGDVVKISSIEGRPFAGGVRVG
jgi:cell wall-associated NlpC family hydrolase